MSMYNPDCPYCHEEIDFEEHFDIEALDAEIYCKATGRCSHCGRDFVWTDCFVLKEFLDLKEITH